MPPLNQQVLVALKGGAGGEGEVLDVACYIGKDFDEIDRWILADIRLETKQIVGWMHVYTVREVKMMMKELEECRLQLSASA